jgi:hypothetical protein
MPIDRLLQSVTFSPAEIKEIVSAYEGVLARLHLTDRTDPVTELVAKQVLECAKDGEIERQRLRDCALAAFR